MPACRATLALAIALTLTLLGGATAAGAADSPELWLFLQTNLLVPRNVDRALDILARASKAGYSAVLLGDSKFCRLGSLGPEYFAQVRRVIAAAQADRLRIVPAICPIGYSSDLLSGDPDLAEALPVKDQLFAAKGGQLVLIPDPQVALPATGGPQGWSWHDDCITFADGAATVGAQAGNARLVAQLKVSPFREYHVSVEIRTQDFTGTPEIKALAGSDAMQYADLGVKRTQDWTRHDILFNSLDHAAIALYLGQWGASRGTLSWRHATIEETGLVNLVRRPGAPLTIQGENGPIAEGPQVDRVVDAKTGRRAWPGDYDSWHQAPTIRTRLPEGAQVRLSYYHAMVVGDGQVMICPSEPKSLTLITDSIRRIDTLFHAGTYFLSHDEIRVLGWDAACTDRKLTPGRILAENLKACIAAAHAIAPRAHLAVWSDMFDPNHNAHDRYYLVNGDLKDSWKGLEPGMTVALWYREKAKLSADFFAAQRCRLMIAGYYDGPVAGIDQWLDATAGHPIDAVMYTTWVADYASLEAFADRVRAYVGAHQGFLGPQAAEAASSASGR